MYLYLTIFLSWGVMNASVDSTGVHPYFSSNDYQNCYIYTKNSKINKCIQEVEAYDKERCEKAASKFATKHEQPQEPCIRMKVKTYNTLIQNGEVKYLFEPKPNPNTPVCGGHICKKNRKGKLYACIKYKDSCS